MPSILENNYIEEYKAFLNSEYLKLFIDNFINLITDIHQGAQYFFAGNGASAAVASHLANDFSKALSLPAKTFHDPALITCFANDYGYDNWLAEAVKLYAKKGDVLVLISSSGRSKNIINAATTGKSLGVKVVALTGPEPDHVLSQCSILSLKVESYLYNIIECCHMMALCAVVDSYNPVRLSKCDEHYVQ